MLEQTRKVVRNEMATILWAVPDLKSLSCSSRRQFLRLRHWRHLVANQCESDGLLSRGRQLSRCLFLFPCGVWYSADCFMATSLF